MQKVEAADNEVKVEYYAREDGDDSALVDGLDDREQEIIRKVEQGVDINQIVEEDYTKKYEKKDNRPSLFGFGPTLDDITGSLGEMKGSLGYFVPGLRIQDDVDKFRYSVKANRRINQIAVSRVFKKTGNYIFHLGAVNFFELLIINLFLVIHCFYRENQLYRDAMQQGLTQTSTLPFIRTHVSKSGQNHC